MDYMSTDFGADSSSRFPFTARTIRQKNRQANIQTDATECLTHVGGYRHTAGVGNERNTMQCSGVQTCNCISQCSTVVLTLL